MRGVQPACVSAETKQLGAEMATLLPLQAGGETGTSLCVGVTKVSMMKVVGHRVTWAVTCQHIYWVTPRQGCFQPLGFVL